MSDISTRVVDGIHDVVWVRGPDTIAFLDGLLSQHLATLESGAAAHSFLLAPNGKLRAPLVVWRGDDEVALVTARGAGRIVAGDLTRFRIRVDVAIEPETATTLTVVGDGARVTLAAAGVDVPAGAVWTPSPVVAGAVPFVLDGPSRYVTVGPTIEELEAAGAEHVSASDLEALRIERGEPIVGRDVDDGTIPQEMGPVEHAVSFTKGCYLGQELVARIDSRGHVNRHLRGIVIDADILPPPGAELVAADKVVGSLTSVSRSPRLGVGIAMALVRREVAPGDAVDVTWDGGAAVAEVRELPLD
jgi:folate-binding protein YgfZ